MKHGSINHLEHLTFCSIMIIQLLLSPNALFQHPSLPYPISMTNQGLLAPHHYLNSPILIFFPHFFLLGLFKSLSNSRSLFFIRYTLEDTFKQR